MIMPGINKGNLKIALIYPPAKHPIRDAGMAPHMSLLALASHTRLKYPDASFSYFDGHHTSLGAIIAKVRNEKPDVAAMSVDFTNYEHGLVIAEHVKNLGVKVIMGGNHAHSLHENILRLRNNEVDLIALGSDGEVAFGGFLDHVAGNRSISAIPSSAYFDANLGKPIAHPVELLDLSTLPRPAYDLIDIDSYFKRQASLFGAAYRMMQVYSLKGCTNKFRCSFCGRYTDGIRTRDAEVFMKEVIELVTKYDLTEVWDRSDTFLHKGMLRKVHTFLTRLPRGENPFAEKKVTFKTYGRGDQIDEEVVRFMRALNFRILFVGYESGDNRMLFEMGKVQDSGIDLLARYREGTRALIASGIEVDSSFILGLPQESAESLENTKKFIRWLLDIGVRKFRLNEPLVLPGTRLNDLVEKHSPALARTDMFDMEVRQGLLYEAYRNEGWLNDFGGSVDSFQSAILNAVADIRAMVKAAGGACEGSGHYAKSDEVYFSEGQEVKHK